MAARYTVGISEMAFGCESGDLIVTHALGSCLGVAIHDAEACVGGILHYMLPTGTLDAEKARKSPLMFGDIGIPAFFQEAYRLGARKDRMRVVIAGGANVIAGNEHSPAEAPDVSATIRDMAKQRLGQSLNPR